MHQAHAKISNYHTCMQLLHTACHIESRHAINIWIKFTVTEVVNVMCSEKIAAAENFTNK